MSELFDIELRGNYRPTIEDIWPDGDAPENPTAEMVAQLMRSYGEMWWMLREWNLEPEEVIVYGGGSFALVWPYSTPDDAQAASPESSPLAGGGAE